jgi:small subunit ribosomal protein S6
MRRYELMLVLRPDTADDRVQQILDRTTRGISDGEGQIVKVSPWGRRRLAYPIAGHREGSYFIILFDAPSEAIAELERGLNITEEVMRHLVTRIDRPASRRSDRGDGDDDPDAGDDYDDDDRPPPDDDDEDYDDEKIDESESEAAPRATD